MNYKQLFPDEDFEEVIICWEKPFELSDIKIKGVANNDNGYFYKILGVYNNRFHLLYIGKTFRQYISKRLLNADHLLKQSRFQVDHPRYKLYLSVGLIESPEYPSATLVDNIERLLIYSHNNSYHKYFKNKAGILSHKVIKNYKVINKGFKQDNMFKEIAYGLFFK